ncbi:MAG: hypothetical protein ABSD39_12075 [Terriglobales bacterium]|jgi:hypothetical protein
MPASAGLQTNLMTWLVMTALAACWAISVRLTPGWKQEGWPALLKSVYGFVWLGFGLDIVLRFLMLSYNAVEWGNDTSRLVALPVETVNYTLAYCGAFWLLLATGYAVALRRPTAGPLRLTRVFTLDLVYGSAVPAALLFSLLFYLTDVPDRVPVVLLTPLGVLAGLYMIPATIVWWDHFARPGPWWRISSLHVIVLLPAFVNGWLSPYRENFTPLFLIPLVAALFAGRRPVLAKAVPVGLACFLVLSTLVGSYRQIKWENTRPEEVASEVRSAGLLEWFTGDFGRRMARFHSFDSFLLTMHLVPNAQPYSGRDVLVRPFIHGFVPRLLNSSKEAADAGEKFGANIWAYDDPKARDHGGAAIAPSMPGDLYDAGGVLYLALGALMWGAVLGLVDGWKSHLPGFVAAALTALMATHCAMSIERDFDHEVAGLIQMLLVVLVVSGVIALSRRRETEFSLGFDPGLERG